MSDLSLFDIDNDLHELLTQWQEAAPDAIEPAQEAIREYIGQVIQSVDPIRRYIRFCDSAECEAQEEAQVQLKRARMWAARRDRLKAFVQDFMSQWGWRPGKPRKFESATGSLSLRGNGGLEPLTITDPALVPDELCTVTISFRADSAIVKQSLQECPQLVGPRLPSNVLIRAALAKPCDTCDGTGNGAGFGASVGNIYPVKCPMCEGSGKRSVPGCRLEPRGESLVVR